MTLEEFRELLTVEHPPAALPPALKALWHDARGEWDAAHEMAQAIEGRTGAWVHAYLHRKEGDLGNASYWYRRAAQPVATNRLEDEWTTIAEALLASLRP